MTAKYRSWAAAIALGLLVSCTARSSKPSVSASMTEATVTGTVTINGELATEGEVEFDPSNYLRKMVSSRTAPIGPDGKYTIKTLVGANTVRVVTQEVPTQRGTAYDEIQFVVQQGENTLDIVVPQAER